MTRDRQATGFQNQAQAALYAADARVAAAAATAAQTAAVARPAGFYERLQVFAGPAMVR